MNKSRMSRVLLSLREREHVTPTALAWCPVTSTKRILLALAILLAPVAALAADEEPRISASLEQHEIYEGQSAVYRVMVENVENPKAPDVPATSDFDVALLRQQSLDSQQITIINGVMQQTVHRGREFQYRLTPKRTGELVVPGPAVKVNGKRLVGTPQRLVVLPASAQDLAAVELAADRQAVYPTQPFTVMLSILVKELPAPRSDDDPLSVQTPRPVLRIPWLTDQELPAGLTPKEDWQQWAKSFIDQEGVGFGINELVQQTAFSFFGRNALAFRPEPRKVARPDAQGRAAHYFRYDFPRTFTAKQAGPIHFGAVALQGTFADGVSESGHLHGKEIYAASKPLALMVRDVPRDGRPDNYCGAVGHFRLEAELTPAQSKVGDPITLTLALRGSGSLAAAKAPDLGKLPDVAARFKVYEATQKTEADAARFVYSLRPLVEGAEPFPAVPVAYFDVDAERFVTVQSEPIPIRVSKAEQLSGDQIVASPRVAGQNAKELEARQEGIFANISDVALVRDQSVRPGHWLAGLGLCSTAYVLAVGGVVALRRRFQDKTALRRRAAVGRARHRLQAALEHWRAGRMREAADGVQDALVGLVADAGDLHEAGLTPKDVLGHLETWAVPDALLARLGRLLDACDAARYGGAAASAGLGDEARQVLDAVIEALRTQKRFRG